MKVISHWRKMTAEDDKETLDPSPQISVEIHQNQKFCLANWTKLLKKKFPRISVCVAYLIVFGKLVVVTSNRIC